MSLAPRILGCVLLFSGVASAEHVPLVVQDPLQPAAQHGLTRFEAAVSARGDSLARTTSPQGRAVIVGVATPDSLLAKWAKAGYFELAGSPEALAVKRFKVDDVQYLALVGSDAMGLQYALFDAAEQLECIPRDGDWFRSLKEISEKPANSMRRMRVMLHHQANEEDTYLQPAYWDWYLDLLVQNRFNALNLVYSHQTSWMAPMYPWHIEVPGFPNVRVKNLTEQRRKRNLEALRTISRKCHERGLEFTLGIWQQLPWIEEFVGTRENQPVYVEGLNAENAREYVYAAMKELLKQVPGVDRVQLRCNDESGIPYEIQTRFYRATAMKAIKEHTPPVKLDLRIAKGTTVAAAREMNMGLRLSTKFFGEFMGMPYTAVETLTRGYSYDEMLRRPFLNPVFHEVWTLGSHRVFLWGSEDYGRRFGRNASYGGAIGFETDGPMAQKGYRDPYSPEWRLLRNKEDEYYRWEMERYWAFFRSVGRFSYNPDTDHEVWMRPFKKRFGDAAETMAEAYEAAGRVIALIVSSHVNNINMYVWPEKSMGGILGVYMDLRGTDKAYFPSIKEQVAEELAGTPTGRPGPDGLAREYEQIAATIDRRLNSDDVKSLTDNKEFLATRADFSMLSHLARYHAHRQRECYRMARFYATGDLSQALPAVHEAEKAVEVWRELVEIANRWYHGPMQFAPVENGHWSDNLFVVEKEPELVKDDIAMLRRYGLFDLGFDFGAPDSTSPFTVFSLWKYANQYQQAARFLGLSTNSLYDVDRGYGWTDARGMESVSPPPVSSRQITGEAPVPGAPFPEGVLYNDFVRSENPFALRLDLPMAPHRFTFIFADKTAQPKDHGPFDVRQGGRHGSSPLKENVTVPAGEVVHYQYDDNVRSDWYPFERFVLQPSKKGADAILSGLVVTTSKPHLAHAPLRRLSPQEDATISATITMPPEPGPNGDLVASSAGKLAEAVLVYRTSRRDPWQRKPMETSDGFVYTAQFPKGSLSGRWMEYSFEATDRAGHVVTLPRPRGAVQRYRVRLTADETAPTVEHTPLIRLVPGQDATLRARVTDPDGVAVVRAYFRPLADIEPYECVEMKRDGDTYTATIPGEIIKPEFEFIYYLEAVDQAGNGRFYPDWKTATAPYVIVPVER